MLNGAGKTSLFNAISGIVPNSGNIRWDKTDLRGRSPAAIARSGLVQCPETRELCGDMSVRERQNRPHDERWGAANACNRAFSDDAAETTDFS
jgi:ABC-type branched-subunit amino acid transport system ATPase component